MNLPRILVAGIGNIFLGDDAFGVEVAGRLAAQNLPSNVEVADFGIRGLDLAYTLLEGHDAVILIDAIPRGGSPGTLYVVAPELEDTGDDDAADFLVETHTLEPAKVLRLVRRMGGRIDRLWLVGCEPSPDAGQMCMGLSGPVAAAVDAAADMVADMIRQISAGHETTQTSNAANVVSMEP